jgi:hypothetical protein
MFHPFFKGALISARLSKDALHFAPFAAIWLVDAESDRFAHGCASPADEPEFEFDVGLVGCAGSVCTVVSLDLPLLAVVEVRASMASLVRFA